jgi:uncharacterized protein (TIGR02246 family)
MFHVLRSNAITRDGRPPVTDWRLGVVLSVGTCAFLVGCGRQAPTNSAEGDVRRVILAYEAAVNSANADAVLALYADDAIWMPENIAPLLGKAAIRLRVDSAFAEIALNKRWHVHEVIVAGAWAIVRATGSGTVTVKASGHEIQESHNELFVLHRDVNREWKIARFIYNSDRPPPPSP